VKRSLLVEATGGPLAVVVSGANTHDTKLLAETLDAVIVARPEPTEEAPQSASGGSGQGVRQPDRASSGSRAQVPGAHPTDR
jgi:putative transposase